MLDIPCICEDHGPSRYEVPLVLIVIYDCVRYAKGGRVLPAQTFLDDRVDVREVWTIGMCREAVWTYDRV